MIIPIQLRLDENGLIRKECPYCYTEYKIFPESETEESKEKSYCPACGLHAPYDRQLTRDQVEYIQQELMNSVIDQINSGFKKTKRSIRSKNLKFEYKPLKKSDSQTVIELLGLEGVITNCCNETIFIEQPNMYKSIYCPNCGDIRFPV